MTTAQKAIIEKLKAQQAQYGHGRLNHWILDNGQWIDVRDCYALASMGLLKKQWRGVGAQACVEFELAQ